MDITESQNGGVRIVTWQLPNHGWADLSERLDSYLAECFRSVIAAYHDKSIAWMELNYWPDSGRLIVFPSDDGPFGNRNERVCHQLTSDFLQDEFGRICQLPKEHQEGESDALGQKLWERVAECLRIGKAGSILSAARLSHPMKLVAFDFNPGEGLFHLSDIDPIGRAEAERQFAEFKKRYGFAG